MQEKKTSGSRIYKVFIYVALIALAVSIVVPVFWVFMASIKQNSEFYGNPGRCPLDSTGRTLLTPGTPPRWASTCSTL